MPLASDARDRITLQRLVEDADGVTKTWTAIDTVWAATEPQGDGRYRFRIRYRTDLPRTRADVEPAMRVLYRGEAYDLDDAVEAVRHTELHLFASRRIVGEIEDLGSGARRINAWP